MILFTERVCQSKSVPQAGRIKRRRLDYQGYEPGQFGTGQIHRGIRPVFSSSPSADRRAVSNVWGLACV